MKSTIRTLGVLTLAALTLAAGQPVTNAATNQATDSVDARLAWLKTSGTKVEYRRADPGEPMTPGVQVIPVTGGSTAAMAQCNRGWLCLYADASRGGLLVPLASGWNVPDLSNVCSNSICYKFNDRMSSWWNRSQYDNCWHYDAHYRGTFRNMRAGTRSDNVGPADNDKASSISGGQCV